MQAKLAEVLKAVKIRVTLLEAHLEDILGFGICVLVSVSVVDLNIYGYLFTTNSACSVGVSTSIQSI